MKVTIKDYNGYNPDCQTVKKILKFIDGKKQCTIYDVFKKGELGYNDTLKVMAYIKEDRLEEYKAWALKRFSFERMFEEHTKELDKLSLAKKIALSEVNRLEGITPAKAYCYFSNPQKYLTDRAFDKYISNVLEAIIATIEFKENDYLELRKVISGKYFCNSNVEYHYRIAIMNNNNTAWKEIEKYLDRKPYLVDGKRCYDGFEFEVARNEYYTCTGWNAKGNIKFILSNNPNRNGKRKLLNFNFDEFKEYFKDKKIERVISM